MWHRFPEARPRTLLDNVGKLDAVARSVGGVALLAFAFLGTELLTVSFVSILGAIILLGTGITRSCPIYKVLGVSSNRR